MFENPSEEIIRNIFEAAHTIAVVGLSADPFRASHDVAKYLQTQRRQHSFRIIPLNPNVENAMWEKVYPDLYSIPLEIKIDVVDVFRRSEFVSEIIQQTILRGDARIIWLQEGVIHEAAAVEARSAGLTVVMDKCMLKEHYRYYVKGK